MTQLEEHQNNDDEEVDAFGDFDEVTRTVTITDGKLTLSPSTGCYNTKLMFIEVTPVGGSSGSGSTTTQGLSAAASYKYDALGRRLQKTTGGVTTTFVHDGDQVVAEYEGATLKRGYIYGTYIDEPLAMVAQTGTLYYHQNRIYHVMAMTSSSGALAERYGYSAYGKRRVVSPGGTALTASAVGNQVGFTGRYHDAETQLTYFRARYMDAELGRFVGRDPLGYVDGLSLYGYVRHNPVGATDPLGLECAEQVGPGEGGGAADGEGLTVTVFGNPLPKPEPPSKPQQVGGPLPPAGSGRSVPPCEPCCENNKALCLGRAEAARKRGLEACRTDPDRQLARRLCDTVCQPGNSRQVDQPATLPQIIACLGCQLTYFDGLTRSDGAVVAIFVVERETCEGRFDTCSRLCETRETCEV